MQKSKFTEQRLALLRKRREGRAAIGKSCRQPNISKTAFRHRKNCDDQGAISLHHYGSSKEQNTDSGNKQRTGIWLGEIVRNVIPAAFGTSATSAAARLSTKHLSDQSKRHRPRNTDFDQWRRIWSCADDDFWHAEPAIVTSRTRPVEDAATSPQQLSHGYGTLCRTKAFQRLKFVGTTQDIQDCGKDIKIGFSHPEGRTDNRLDDPLRHKRFMRANPSYRTGTGHVERQRCDDAHQPPSSLGNVVPAQLAEAIRSLSSMPFHRHEPSQEIGDSR